MSADPFGFEDEWFHRPFRTHRSKLLPRQYAQFSMPPLLMHYGPDGIWMKRYKWRTAQRRNDKPGPSSFPRFKLYRAIAKAAARAALRPPTCEPTEHDWNNEGVNPDHCLKCGMSFTRYIFTECE